MTPTQRLRRIRNNLWLSRLFLPLNLYIAFLAWCLIVCKAGPRIAGEIAGDYLRHWRGYRAACRTALSPTPAAEDRGPGGNRPAAAKGEA